MAITPDNPISLSLQYARLLIARSSTFQTWRGAANETEALTGVHLFAPPGPPDLDGAGPTSHTRGQFETMRPFAVVGLPEPAVYEAVATSGGAALHFARRGQIIVQIEDDVPVALADDESEADAAINFCNQFGGIIKDIIGEPDVTAPLSGSSGNLFVRELSIVEGPVRQERSEEGDIGDYFWVQLALDWGIG